MTFNQFLIALSFNLLTQTPGVFLGVYLAIKLGNFKKKDKMTLDEARLVLAKSITNKVVENNTLL